MECRIQEGQLGEEALNSPDAPHTKEIQRVGRLVGELLAHQVFNGLLHLPNDSLVQPSFVDFDQIKVGPHTSALPYDKPGVASVLDLGAGLSGKRFIDWMVRRIATQSSFAQYLPINKGPMQSSFLHNYAGYSFNALQPGLANAIIGQYYIGREEGMDEFTEFISAEDTANSMISAVVCNGVSTVDADEVCRSLARVPDMVRPGGVVVVGLCVQPVVEGGAIYDQAHQTLVDAGMNVTDTFSQITGGYNRDQVESRFSIFKHANSQKGSYSTRPKNSPSGQARRREFLFWRILHLLGTKPCHRTHIRFRSFAPKKLQSPLKSGTIPHLLSLNGT